MALNANKNYIMENDLYTKMFNQYKDIQVLSEFYLLIENYITTKNHLNEAQEIINTERRKVIPRYNRIERCIRVLEICQPQKQEYETKLNDFILNLIKKSRES